MLRTREVLRRHRESNVVLEVLPSALAARNFGLMQSLPHSFREGATSAYAEFAEKDKGTLEPGKLADLAVLSQDIFTVSASDLPKTTSLLTLVGGRVVYDAGILH